MEVLGFAAGRWSAGETHEDAVLAGSDSSGRTVFANCSCSHPHMEIFKFYNSAAEPDREMLKLQN